VKAPIPVPSPGGRGEAEDVDTSNEEKQRDPRIDASAVLLPAVAAEVRAKVEMEAVSAASIDEIVMQIAGVHSDVEKHLLQGLADLDEAALRTRLAQLIAEALERNKWEPVRSAQALRKLSADVSDKYAALMAQQRRELEGEFSRILSQVEQELLAEQGKEMDRKRNTMDKVAAAALAEQAVNMNTKALQVHQAKRAEIAATVNEALATEITALRKADSERMLPLVERVRVALKTLESRIATAAPEGGTEAGVKEVQAHRRLAAALKAERALRTSLPVAAEMKELMEVFGSDPLLEAIFEKGSGTSSSSFVDVGAPTLVELKSRFWEMRKEVCVAHLAPAAAPRVLGGLIGSALYALTPDVSGMVDGSKPEEVLARAGFFLERSLLEDAVKEVTALQESGQKGGELSALWLADAQRRLAADGAMRLIIARSLSDR
jgi:hypothetical protein